MQTPSTLYLWLSDQAGPLGLIALVLASLLVTLSLSARNRRRRMNAIRAGRNEETFVATLALDGFDRFLARATYRYLQQIQGISFPIEREDSLDQDLGLDSADLEETIRALLHATERLYEPGRRSSPIVTVEDLVRFLQASPRLRASAA